MTRDDLLTLSDDALADLTNRGTLRRALKELDGGMAVELEVAADGTLRATSPDAVSEFPPGVGFAQWRCDCLAGGGCRHLVRAVLAYRRSAEPDAAGVSPAAAEPEQASQAGDPPEQPGEPPAKPGDLTDLEALAQQHDALAAILKAPTLRAAQRLIDAGPLAHVGRVGEITTVRLHHPVPVTVRFLAGSDLAFVRCTCRDPDPCVHVPVALAVLRGRTFGETGLRVLDGDTWRPEQRVLQATRDGLRELFAVGAEAGQARLKPLLTRLVATLREAELTHLADLVNDVLGELERYAEVDSRFDPVLLVRLVGEILARTRSLSSANADRVPDRLVAGTPAKPADAGSSTLIGMGTQLLEADERCTFVAYLVDARSGSPVRVRKSVDDPDYTAADRLRSGLVGGASVPMWGGGQVLTPGGKRFGFGDFTPARRVTALPGAALNKLPEPFLVADLAGLAAQLTRLPAALDDRSAGSGLAACRFVEVRDVGFDPGEREVRATLIDAAGATATLAHTWTPRQAGALGATAALLERWGEGECFVAGRWRWVRGGPVVDPLLVQRGDVSLQPHVAAPVGKPLEVVDACGELTSPGALLRDLDAVLGETLVAGWDRIARRPERWREFAARCGSVGASRLARLAGRIAEDEAALDALMELATFGVFAHPRTLAG